MMELGVNIAGIFLLYIFGVFLVCVPPSVSWLGKQRVTCTTGSFKVLIKQVTVYFSHLLVVGWKQ
jgi:hypothetical protein